MKRSEMVDIINNQMFGGSSNPDHVNQCVALLNVIEKAGMAPPSVSEEDRQAIMHVYYMGYTFHQWDEELAKDEKVQEAKKKRAEYKALTPEERKARRQKWRESRETKRSTATDS